MSENQNLFRPLCVMEMGHQYNADGDIKARAKYVGVIVILIHLPLGQNGRNFADDIVRCMFVNVLYFD